MIEYIATFYSHYGAICFRKSCQSMGLEAVVMPVPRNLSSSCGTGVRFHSLKDSFPQINEELEQIVQVTPDGYQPVYCAEEI